MFACRSLRKVTRGIFHDLPCVRDPEGVREVFRAPQGHESLPFLSGISPQRHPLRNAATVVDIHLLDIANTSPVTVMDGQLFESFWILEHVLRRDHGEDDTLSGAHDALYAQ
jgi:hypothetical protein